MRHLAILISAVALGACGSASNGQRASSQPSADGTSRSYDAAGFERVAVEGAAQLIVRTGAAASVRAEGDPDVLDRLAYRSTVFAFPLFTIGIICGAIWAEAAWGRFWGWDPKETVAFVSWVVFAAYLHARATAGWRGRPAAWINSLGFALTVFNLFFINLVTTGMHSYAGVG